MMRKHLLFYALSCFIAFGLSNCKTYDDPSNPSKSSLVVDKTTGLSGVTEFTFTITQVSAKSISLLPEGDGKPGLLVASSSFADGKAIVKYTYSNIGTFNAVIKTTNTSEDGKTVLQAVSDPVSITITSDDNAMTSFSFASPSSTSTAILDKVSSNSDTINVVLPYNPYNTIGLSSLKAKFTSSAFSSVSVGSTAQVSGTTSNNFSSTVTYTVTSASGKPRTYLVNVSIMAVGTGNGVKSASAAVLSKGDFNGKTYDAFIDNTNKVIAVVLPSTADNSLLDSLKFSYVVTDSTSRGDLAQGLKFDLTGANTKTLNVKSQSGVTATYTIYAVIAPALNITISNLTPTVKGKITDWSIGLTCLKGTDLTTLAFSYNVGGVTVVNYKSSPFVSGTIVDYSSTSKQDFVLSVTDKGITYSTTYSVSVVIVP